MKRIIEFKWNWSYIDSNSIIFWLITVEGLCRIAKLRAEEDICSNWWCTKLEKANNRLDSGLYLKRCVAEVDQGQLVYIYLFSNEGVFLKKFGKKSLCQLFFWRSTPMILLCCLLFWFRWHFLFGHLKIMKPFFAQFFPSLVFGS